MGVITAIRAPSEPTDLRRSGELARSVLAALPRTGIVVFDHDLRYVLCAGEALGDHGLDAAALEGRTLPDVVPAHRLPDLLPHHHAALEGGHPRFVLESRGRCYEVDGAPISAGGRIIGGLLAARDVTEQRLSQRALAAREREFRRLAESASDVISRADLDGVYRYVSPAAERVYGRAPAELVGRRVRDVVHPDDVAACAALRAALEGGADQHVGEVRVAHAKGGWVWVEVRSTALRNAAGELEGVQAAARDITDRKTAEAARRVADQQFKTAFDDAPIGMALVALTGRLLRVNDALCSLLGRSTHELLGSTSAALTHPADLDADRQLRQDVLAGRRSSYRTEKRYLRPNGSVVWAELSVSLVRDEAGAPVHLVAQVHDITERHRLERELHRLATHDELTGLHNRRHFERELALRLAGAAGPGSVLVLLDLDGFKAVNDRFGHHGGDLVLRHVATVLRQAVGPNDEVARFGGDEFALLLTHTGGQDLDTVTRELGARLAASPLGLEGEVVPVRASVGATHLDHVRSEEATLRAADAKLYAVKRARRAEG